MKCFVAIAALAVACTGQTDGNAQRPTDPAAQRVLAALDADTVWLVTNEQRAFIAWTSNQGAQQVVRWESHSVPPHARPEVRLAHVNDDAVPDLFWTLAYEGILGGMLLLGQADSALEVFVTGTEECAVPELIDVDADGLLDIVRYTAGALTATECRGDALALACRARFPTDWASPLFQRDSRFVADPPAAKSFYEGRARLYARGATDLEEALRDGSTPSVRCNEAMLRQLRSLAARADSLSADQGS